VKDQHSTSDDSDEEPVRFTVPPKPSNNPPGIPPEFIYDPEYDAYFPPGERSNYDAEAFSRHLDKTIEEMKGGGLISVDDLRAAGVLKVPPKRRKSRGGGPDKPPLLAAKPIGAAGFAIMGAALAVGTATSAASGAGFLAGWFAVTGFGLGMAMPTMLNAALSALSPERSGSGSALMTAARQVGATIGVAVLGTVLSTVYRSHLSVTGLPAAVSAAARSSVGAGAAVAIRLGSLPLLASVRDAYASGVDVMLWVCAAIAIVAAVLAALFLPRQVTQLPEHPAEGPAATSAELDAAGRE